MVWRIAGSVVGLAMILIGLPLMVSPIPFGLILIVLGIIILVGANPLAASVIRTLRRRYKWLDGFFDRAENVLPRELADPLRATDEQPDPEPAEPPADDDGPRMMTRSSYPRYLR